MWETSLNSTKHPRPLPADVKATAAGQQSLPMDPSARFRTARALTFITYSSASSQDFPRPARSEAQPPGTRPPTSPDAFLEMQLANLSQNLWKRKKVSTPHRLRRARRSSSERAPAPEESRTGRSRSPRSRTFPGSLPPAWCCCWSAWSRLPRGARWSGGWAPRGEKTKKQWSNFSCRNLGENKKRPFKRF